MKNTRKDAAAADTRASFNYNKLQAVACIASSAAVSIGLMYLAIRWFN